MSRFARRIRRPDAPADAILLLSRDDACGVLNNFVAAEITAAIRDLEGRSGSNAGVIGGESAATGQFR